MFSESASDFDAVIFHIRSMEVNGIINSPEERWPENWQNPLERKPSQRYIMFLELFQLVTFLELFLGNSYRNLFFGNNFFISKFEKTVKPVYNDHSWDP